MSYLIIRLNSLFKLNEVPDRKVLCAILNVLNINTLSSCENIQDKSRRSRHIGQESLITELMALFLFILSLTTTNKSKGLRNSIFNLLFFQ